MSTLEQKTAGLQYDQIIELVELDLTPFGGTVYRVYNSIDLGDVLGEVTFLGETWYPLPFTSQGWGSNGSGATPRPVVTLSDYDGILLSNSIQYQDLIGAKLYKYETTYENLADNTFYGPEIWLVNRKAESDGSIMKIELASPIDQSSRKLPSWQMFRQEFPALGRNRWK